MSAAEKTFKLIVEYDGADFFGWQVQPGTRTVQGVLESALEHIAGTKIGVVSAGRTDTGVHAIGMAAHVKLETNLKPSNIMNALNSYLQEDVTVRSVSVENDNFHARFSATGRWYRYRMILRKSSLLRNRVWHVKYKLDINAMKTAAKALIGKVDARGLCAVNPEVTDYLTNVTRCELHYMEEPDKELILDIEAIRFFTRMVRIITGTMVDVGRGYRDPDVIKEIITKGDRSLAGPAAPACGLYLMEVKYN